MREIKFRGKRIDNNKWVYGDLCHKACFELDKDVCCICNKEGDYEVYENTIGQYIGIKDDYGKEIYEGDIVEIEVERYEFDGESTYTNIIKGEIVYTDLSFAIKTGEHKGVPVLSTFVAERTLDCRIISDKWKVIGNVIDGIEEREGEE